MAHASLFPNVMTINIMIDRLCKNQRLDDAYNLFESLREWGCKPDVVTYSSAIDGLGRQHKFDEAYRLFKRMLDEGHAPNVVV